MKVQTAIVYLANLVLLLGCTDQEWHETTSILENQSGYQVSISYYKNGSIDTEFSQVLNINESKEVLVDADAGKGRGLTYPTSIQGGEIDSAVVSFDNRKAVHYGYNKTGRNVNAIIFTDPRNIFNLDSYTERIILETKKREEREVKYTFTQKDYTNAE